MNIKRSVASKTQNEIPSHRSLWQRTLVGIRAIASAPRYEESVRNQLLGACAMLATLVLLQPKPIWWGLCLFGSALCVTMEMVNTTFEKLTDFVCPDLDPQIGRIKDLAAGATVMAGVGTLLVGLVMIADSLGWFN